MDSRRLLTKVITDFIVLSAAMSVPLVSPVENLAVPLSDSPVSEGIGIERNTTTAQTHETAVGLPILIFRVFGNPSVRGFFCNDETIRYPFKESTVPNVALYFVGLGLPIIVMCVTEIMLANQSTEPTTPFYLFGKRLPLWLLKSYEMIGVFCFGAACSQLITDVGKYTIGRLRPHFFDVCDPSVDCTLSMYQYRYITDFTCRGSSSKKLREARLSFPSGHSSFSAYTMVYLAFYIQARVHWKGSVLLKHAAQLACILISWATALSRINDNKHHWSDVTVGLIIGTTVAVVTATFLSTLFPAKNKLDTLEMTTKSSSSHQSMIDDKSRPTVEI